ncbi:hypothetical protein [Paenibacillus elgii]|uniref:hypothetical protein n=1 Tax=Paenibacillus elgii TaxID=189691 RepID=UPI00203B8A23|nr:hypothetical protein [Paenibacillus elgii]MCM3274198.1 hypothetical protein [Paenibacillus elgii]
MSVLYHVCINYKGKPIVNESLHVIGRKNGEVVFDDYYQVIICVDTNYRSVYISWPEYYILPAQCREPSIFGTKFKYYDKSDKLHISGTYGNEKEDFEIVIQLPPKQP